MQTHQQPIPNADTADLIEQHQDINHDDATEDYPYQSPIDTYDELAPPVNPQQRR